MDKLRRTTSLGRRPLAATLAATGAFVMILSGLAAGILKPAVGRDGPSGPQQSNTRAAGLDVRWGRFPSGHTAAAFSVASGLARVYPATAPIGYGLGLPVAYERTSRGIHYLSDCFAGALLGLLASAVIARWVRARPGWSDPDPPRRKARSRPAAPLGLV